MPIDDPTELFDLYDQAGRPLGVEKARALVHRDGDWHKSVHIWVVIQDESLILQRRSLRKDSHPGAVDVSVAGHLRAGESIDAALREAEEEIGLAITMNDVVHLGTRRKEHRTEAMLDREIQEVFLARTWGSLDELRPDPDEVAGVIAVALPEAQALFDGMLAAVSALEIRAAGSLPEPIMLRCTELLAGADTYFAQALVAIERHLRGATPPPIVFR